MTEDEAKAKRCCGPDNTGDALYRCIASACMAWRWHSWSSRSEVGTPDKLIDDPKSGTRLQPNPPDGDGWRRLDTDAAHQLPGWSTWHKDNYGKSPIWGQSARGYCGLAGRP